jgi:hypothetical protein
MFHEDGGTDRQTDMTKLIVACRNFATTPKKSVCIASNVTIEAKEICHVQSVQKLILHEERAVSHPMFALNTPRLTHQSLSSITTIQLQQPPYSLLAAQFDTTKSRAECANNHTSQQTAVAAERDMYSTARAPLKVTTDKFFQTTLSITEQYEVLCFSTGRPQNKCKCLELQQQPMKTTRYVRYQLLTFSHLNPSPPTNHQRSRIHVDRLTYNARP